MTSTTAIEAEALRLWRERERRLPAFVRRMTPDALDRGERRLGSGSRRGRRAARAGT